MSHKENKELWVVVMAKDPELANMIRQDISWPFSAQQKKDQFDKRVKEDKEKRDKETRTCKYCNQFYTEEDNCKERSCQSHFGELIFMESCKMMSK